MALYFGAETAGRVHRAFDQVTADGEVWCYDELNRARALMPPDALTDRIVLLHLRNDGRLQFESRAEPACGAGPWAFSPDAVKLER